MRKSTGSRGTPQSANRDVFRSNDDFSAGSRGVTAGRYARGAVIRIEPCIQTLRVTRDQIIAHLVDGRVISVPLAWSWRLSEATPAQRANFRVIGTGQGIHWPDVDEDISVEGMLNGTPAPRPSSRTQPIVRDANRTVKSATKAVSGKARR